MRVFTLRKPPKVGSRVAMMLGTLEEPVGVGCSVTWIRSVGLFKHEIGLEFVDLPPFVKAALTRIARCAATNETVLPSLNEFRRQALPPRNP